MSFYRPLRPLAALASFAVQGAFLIALQSSADDADTPASWTAREQLHPVLWMQRSAEYRALAEQTWRLAAERLHVAAEPGTAALEQSAMPSDELASLPTAVVLDIDETVLDNSFFQAGLVRERRNFSPEAWDAWVAQASAPAIPGARAFVEAAARHGHRIFFVTNRDCPARAPSSGDPCPQQTATMRNLEKLGIAGADEESNFLLRNERPEWATSSKTARRAWIAERYRIVAMAGDDLRDFIERDEFEARRAELGPLFGTRWFLLPNAMYGSWERALSDPACPEGMPREACPDAQLMRKYSLLDPDPPALELDGGGAWRPRERLRVATWNLEWLMTPATLAALRRGCAPAGERVPASDRRLPCNVAEQGSRSEADFAALRRYAAALAADVVALQEVDGPEAAELVFPGYVFCFSSNLHVQKTGFAIRRGLPHRCEAEFLPLSLGDEVRRGAVATLFPGAADEMTLMSVHLKSGCPAGPLTQDDPDCPPLARQAEILEGWIDEQAGLGRRLAVLGDFNRRFALERGPARDAEGRIVAFWPEIDDRDPPAADLTDVTAGARFRECRSDEPYTAYIDTVVLGRELARRRVRGGFIRTTYSTADAEQFRLSDHCPVGVELSLRSR
jgi:5'-nucleotidase (lipoprotein e(P4) family)